MGWDRAGKQGKLIMGRKGAPHPADGNQEGLAHSTMNLVFSENMSWFVICLYKVLL